MSHLYPLKLSYIDKTALWGGDTLKREYNKPSRHEKLSETWELSVRPDAVNKIANGTAAGKTLAEYFAAYPDTLGVFAGKPFPLLIKFIDANDCLSVQVHPDDAYAAKSGDQGKTEMWYILKAEPNAELIYGLAEGKTAADLGEAIAKGTVEDVVQKIPVTAGDCFFIPSGMLHAIGRGIVIAEIQQNSDLTYRVYDYDRRGADGKLRPLHIDDAVAVTRPFTKEQIDAIRYERGHDAAALADCRYFRVERREIDGDGVIAVPDDRFLSVLCTDGEGTLGGEPISRGDSYLLPCGLSDVSVSGRLSLILSTAN